MSHGPYRRRSLSMAMAMAGGGRLNLLSFIALFSLLAVAPAVGASGCGLHPVPSSIPAFSELLKEEDVQDYPATRGARCEARVAKLHSWILLRTLASSFPAYAFGEEWKGIPGSVKILTEYDLIFYRSALKKFMSKGKMPSRGKMIQSAISVVQFSSMEERIWALNKILILLEDMYDVYYFMKYNGIVSVIESLDSEEVEARAVSAWILGKVCQISPHLQNELLTRNVLHKLMKMVKSTIEDEAVKALCAVSDIIKNNSYAIYMFYGVHGGAVLLKDILSSTTGNARLLRRAVFVADFAWYYLSVPDAGPFSSVASESLLISMVNVLNSTDFLLKKKAVFLLRKIMLHLKANEVTSMKEAGLDAALWNMLTELDVLEGEGEGEEEGVKDILGQTIHLIHLSTGLCYSIYGDFCLAGFTLL